MDVKFFRPFVDALVNTLKTQCQIEVAADKPFFKSSGQMQAVSVSAMIDMSSNAFKGVMALRFSSGVFLKMVENMFGEAPGEITDEHKDVAAEIINIVIKQANLDLKKSGYVMNQANVSVSIGPDAGADGSCVVIPFNAGNGPVYFEIQNN